MCKNYRFLAIILLFFCFSASSLAQSKQKLGSTTFKSVDLYYGLSKGIPIDIELNVMVVTPAGVYYGMYDLPYYAVVGNVAPLISWTGPGTAPVLKLSAFGYASDSLCPGIDSSLFYCRYNAFDITVASDGYGCPWLTSSYINTRATSSQGHSYRGPTVRDSQCSVPIDTYDISWSPDAVQHEKLLKITPNGGTVETTLHTYLMESNMLCDSSNLDARGAYCRYVATGATLTVLGCDNSIVTTTAIAHPITDKELHDINVSVDTKNIGAGTINATCNFQYIIEQL